MKSEEPEKCVECLEDLEAWHRERHRDTNINYIGITNRKGRGYPARRAGRPGKLLGHRVQNPAPDRGCVRGQNV